MKKDRFLIRRTVRLTALLLCLALLSALLPLSLAGAAETGKTVRVGWYDPPFTMMDRFGRRSGYAYEYQRKIAAYAGWTFEYVEGSWLELMQKLENGEIDLMSDVSYKEERAERMLYASLPMGTEVYYLYVSPDNTEISSGNYATLNGKKIGVTRGSVQRDLFLSWAQSHGITPEVRETDTSEEGTIALLADGTLDGVVTLDVYGAPGTVTPVCKIGSSDFYFTVSKGRQDLLTELDEAMNRIQDDNRYYNQQLAEKYLRSAGANRYLSAAEQEWLSAHGPIRVGYQDNYLAFCASDASGELTGALKDYLAYADDTLENAELVFETAAYPTAAAAMDALKAGEIDCMFPANLTDYDAETVGVMMTAPIVRTEMDAVVRAADQKEFLRQEKVTVAVNEGNTNYEMFLAEYYPGWDIAYFRDTPAGLEAVAAGRADCVIISNYRFSNISRQCEKLHLDTVYTGVDMDYSFAVRQGDTQLYSILSRVIDTVPSSVVSAALTYHSTEDAKLSFGDIMLDHLAAVMTGIATILAIILALTLRGIRAERKANEEHRKVSDLNRRVYVDALTSVRNKGAFDDYIASLQDQIDRGERPEFAVGMFDCDNLKTVNDQNGHDKGDEYLKAASRLICRIFQHSPVFRIGGDEFAVILQNEDFANRFTLAAKFDKTRKEICAAAEHDWEEVHVAMGIAAYEPQSDADVSDTVRRADKIMYENKRRAKTGRR